MGVGTSRACCQAFRVCSGGVTRGQENHSSLKDRGAWTSGCGGPQKALCQGCVVARCVFLTSSSGQGKGD